jgi:N-acylneuraminate cytidylyltransferase
MINGKSVLAIIPARGGSKGVPRKNIRLLAGKPLIAWTIEAAKKSAFIDRLILSSEDAEIIDVARSWGCEAPFVRPEDLASDDTPGIDPVLHALDALPGYDYVVLLQPTSPLRETADIDGCIGRCVDSDAPACVSVSAPAQHPYWTYRMDGAGHLSPLFDKVPDRRQDLPDVYALNGAVYVARTMDLRHTRDFLMAGTVAFVMPDSQALDIDTLADLTLAEYLFERKNDQQ